EGQALDKEFEQRRSITLDEYFEMIDKKTGKLFSIACEIGALLGNAGQKEISAMREYGKMVGRAFQVQDDLLDVVTDQTVLGKNFASDLFEKKKTFLVVYVLATEFAKNFSGFFEKSELTDDDIKHLIDLFSKSGAIAAARKEIKTSLKGARQALENVPDHPSLQYLSDLLSFIENRNF
ncbi:polyprenyl synthetase family protein, partial [candidate division KSB1 bacterium]|nr:polyprenyl synthetase family protein [candidate division KSB1 bacterium]